jgi:glutamate/tyrosine decarboxylase-like PLP-dependent enzyme
MILRIDLDSFRAAIQRDLTNGHAPFLIVATAGTTGAGVIDPLPHIASIAREYGLWFHVDAAWGGAAALVPELHPVLDGIELADSITFDAHKWLSVSMGAGIFLTRHPDILSRCFATQTAYMPKESEGMQVADPFAHSLQWSRRFIGLKLFLSLAVAGWDGYAAAIRHQTEMGELLRDRSKINGRLLTEHLCRLSASVMERPSGTRIPARRLLMQWSRPVKHGFLQFSSVNRSGPHFVLVSPTTKRNRIRSMLCSLF